MRPFPHIVFLTILGTIAPAAAWSAPSTVKMTLIVFYEMGEAAVGADYGDQILRAKACALDTPTTTVEIVAYTDTNGSSAANKQLSQRRADSVSASLVAAGVPEERITKVEGLGEAAGNAAFSRRAEILIMDDGEAPDPSAAGEGNASQQSEQDSCDWS